MCTFCTLCTLCTLCTFQENVVHFRNHIESSCALGYTQCRNRGRQASFQYSFAPPYIWMCAQKAGSNTLETCSWDRGWVLWKSAHSAQRAHKVQRVPEVQTPSSLMYRNITNYATVPLEGGSNTCLSNNLYHPKILFLSSGWSFAVQNFGNIFFFPFSFHRSPVGILRLEVISSRQRRV